MAIFSIIAFMRRLPRLAALAMLAVALAAPAHADDARPPLRLLAAGSLKTAFTALIAHWNSHHPGQPVAMENGPAGWLRQRIEQGERYDVYASAALSHAEALYAQGLSGPAVLFAHNALCALVKADAPISADTLVPTLLQPTTRIATSIRDELRRRKSHPEVLRYCSIEVLKKAHFHACLEATKQ